MSTGWSLTVLHGMRLDEPGTCVEVELDGHVVGWVWPAKRHQLDGPWCYQRAQRVRDFGSPDGEVPSQMLAVLALKPGAVTDGVDRG